MSGPAAVVLAGPPGDAVARALLARAAAWAREVAPGADYVVGADGPRTLLVAGDPLREGAIDAAAQAFAAGHSPVLLATAESAALSRAHGDAALDDLSHGCDLVIGPLMSGGWYLLGLARPLPEIVDLPAESWESPDVTAVAVAAAQRAGLTIGLLRPERRLVTAADRRAALVDPMLPRDLRAVLTSHRG